jgi:hypothetical protein
MPSRFTTTAAAALLALGLTAAPALAQDQQAPAAADITDEQLDQFAEAALAVNQVGREYASRLQSVEDESQAEQIRAEAQEAMVEAVREEGLSVDEYNAIYTAAENDEEVNAAIQALLQEKQQNSGG